VKIVIGSTSIHKIGAVQDACAALQIHAEVRGYAAKSNVNEQPYGPIETRCGAHNRAGEAWRNRIVGEVVAIGIESGVFPLHDPGWLGGSHPGEYIDAAIVVAMGYGVSVAALASGHSVDPSDVEIARLRGFDRHTVSSVTRERTGCDATDSTPLYTGGKVGRRECLAQAVKIALASLLVQTGRMRRDFAANHDELVTLDPRGFVP
jgi:non-canonical (house-cleaning) NTP pyrophosphatase